MTVADFSQVDFIEVFNNSESLHEVNERGLDGWQALVLRGEKLAATSGMDLHGARDMSMNFATYVEGEPNGDPALELERAIRSQQTWLSKGLALRWSLDAEDVYKRQSVLLISPLSDRSYNSATTHSSTKNRPMIMRGTPSFLMSAG